MKIPGFTAQASLGKTKEHYDLTSGTTVAAGKIVPQGFINTPNGDLVYCYNEGGFSGCFTVMHHHAYTLM